MIGVASRGKTPHLKPVLLWLDGLSASFLAPRPWISLHYNERCVQSRERDVMPIPAIHLLKINSGSHVETGGTSVTMRSATSSGTRNGQMTLAMRANGTREMMLTM